MLKNNQSMQNAALPAAKVNLSWIGWALGLAATLGFSIATPLSRYAIVGGMSPTTLLLARLLLSMVFLSAYVLISKPGQLKLDRRGLLAAIGMGFLNGVSTLTFYESLRFLDASLAIMLFAANPVVVLALLALRGEKFTYRQTIRVGLALGGIYLLTGPGGAANWIGVLLVAATIILFSIQMVGVQWYLQANDTTVVTFYIAAVATLVTAVWWWVLGEGWPVFSAQSWLSIALLAIVSTFIARLCFYNAIQRLGSGQMALLMPTETLLAVIWSLLFLGERLTLLQWLGAGLILTSALLAIQRLGRVRWPARWRAWMLRD